MKILFVCLALVAVVLADQPWQNCGSSSDHLKIDSLTITPATLTPGKPFTVAFKGSLDEEITGGSAHIDVTYLGVKIFSHTYDVCSFPGFACPMAKGPVDVSKTETMPSVVPKGTYKGKITILDQNSQEVACLTFDMPVAVSLNDPIYDDEMIEAINNSGLWTAKRHARFEGMTVGDVVDMLGTSKRDNDIPSVVLHAEAIPDSFDARKQWPNCIHPIRDQAQCGSCWAFGATEALSDRFCVASSGATNVVLSPQYLVSCDSTDYGCEGGYLNNAWDFMQNSGVCDETCWPYASGTGSVPACRTTCTDGSAMKLYKCSDVKHPADVASMQTEIMTNGPVEVAFEVYQDFMSYSGGVYQHVSGSFLGGHAIKALGWGVENGKAYWLCANSWGTSWGLDGFFMILRGSDECGIEDQTYCGTPVL
eukprot:TRINITY_DN14_c0_g1_i2.p2 TRINITY_DN14_c0_g1~~TRINITY_DN14_c0_g1_i2.p2  ORF type:complete len:422 (-),score=59.80 TRINITY_DN14_c0_g1_i2:150-1415(-)